MPKPKKKLSRAEQIAHEEAYVAFLRNRLDSANYKAKVPPEEYADTVAKYDKAKFRLKSLKLS